METHKRITITVSDDVYSRLKSHADGNDWTVPVLVRRTVEAVLSANCLPTVSNLSNAVYTDSSGVVRLDPGCDSTDEEVYATAHELSVARAQVAPVVTPAV